MEYDSFFDFLDEKRPSTFLGRKGETESPEPKESIIPNERIAFLLFPFFIELIDQFKDSLKNLRNFTRVFQEKYSDTGFGSNLNRMIGEEIKKIELVQNSLTNYIRINNPIIKTNTVNTLIEEELKKYHFELEEKKIKLFKTLEKDLPETAVPDDQLRYILSCVMQYVTALIPPNGSFGLFTKSLVLQRERSEDQARVQREGRYIEILMGYTGYKKPMEQFGEPLGTPARQKQKTLDIALRLVDEVVQRNRGMMKFEEDEKKAKASISLRFPVERRKIVYYQQQSELTSNVHEFKSTFEKLSSLEKMKKDL